MTYAFRDVSGADPERPWINGFRKNSSSQERAPKMRFSVLLNSLVSLLLCYFSSVFLGDLRDINFLWSGNNCVPYLVTPGSFFLFFLLRAAIFCLFVRVAIVYGKIANNGERITFYLWNQVVNSENVCRRENIKWLVNISSPDFLKLVL